MAWDKEARNRLASEDGAIRKDWGGKLPIALIYPNSYNLGMSNLGIHAIYSWLNSQPDVVCERVFWEKTERGTSTPAVSIESRRPLTDFAVLAFSITYELDYFNIPKILKNSGVPLYSRERDEAHPLVIAGGACITANPMPVAPFIDCLCIGDAEAILPQLLPVLRQGTLQPVARDDMLAALSDLPGAYVQRRPKKTVTRQWTKHLDDFPVHSVILTPDTELGDMYLIEVERGCPWGCRYCLVCGAFNPMRIHSLDSLLAQAKDGLKYRRRLGLVGPDVPDHPQFEELLAQLKALGADISISSLRIKPLYPQALSEIARGTGTVALALEAGSERLRRVIKKGITEDDIMRAMEVVAEQNIKQLRLYFMIGLPTETDSDVDAIVDLTIKCKAAVEQNQKGARITLSVAPFVPKAGTPFEWMPMEDLAVLDHRLTRLRSVLRPKGIKVAGESPAWSEVQAVLARGDNRLAAVLADVEEVSIRAWRDALRKHGLDANRYAHERWEAGEELPWGIIDSGRSLEYLKQELERALADVGHD